MTPADWERIEALFNQALDLPESERQSFLDRSCPPGDRLRAEVESLLEAEAPARQWLDRPPSRVAADLLDRHPGGLSAGQLILHYKVEKLIAMGGMGEVYLATDTR